MEIGAMLDELREKALKDRNIWQELMDTRKAEQPLAAFCAKCRELGYQIYEMDLITAGEEFYATMRRSACAGTFCRSETSIYTGSDRFCTETWKWCGISSVHSGKRTGSVRNAERM